MESQPLVSVVIPFYNAEKTLESMLKSVLSQTWSNLQIILVNDGSTDGSLELANRLAAKDPRVTVLSQENGGVSSARNYGMTFCTGKYIRFVDADDTLPPESTGLLAARAERDGADLAIGGYTQIFHQISHSFNLEDRDDTLTCSELLPLLCRKSNTYFYGVLWNKIFLREKIEEAGLRFRDRLTFGEDFAFVMGYLKTAEKIAFLKEYLYDYRRTAGSATFRQAFSCVTHPMPNIRTKRELYSCLKDLYVSRGEYEKYRKTLWLYLFRVGLDK